MVRQVKKNNTPIWYLGIKGAGHKFKKKPLVAAQFYTIVMFVKRYLLGTESTLADEGEKAEKRNPRVSNRRTE